MKSKSKYLEATYSTADSFWGSAVQIVLEKAEAILQNFKRSDLVTMMVAAGWLLVETFSDHDGPVYFHGKDRMYFQKEKRRLFVPVDRATDRAEANIVSFLENDGQISFDLVPLNVSASDVTPVTTKVAMGDIVPIFIGDHAARLGFRTEVRGYYTDRKAEIEKHLESLEVKEEKK
jgi:hypothetical protein